MTEPSTSSQTAPLRAAASALEVGAEAGVGQAAVEGGAGAEAGEDGAESLAEVGEGAAPRREVAEEPELLDGGVVGAGLLLGDVGNDLLPGGVLAGLQGVELPVQAGGGFALPAGLLLGGLSLLLPAADLPLDAVPSYLSANA